MRGFWGFWLACSLSGLAGCVVPVGPDWTDPPVNAPPFIRSANPPIGSLLAADGDAGQPLEIGVVLADQNTSDNLYLRWIVDYPPYQDGATRLALASALPGGDSIDRQTVHFAPNCVDDQIANGFTNHRLLLAISDRPFLDAVANPRNLDAVPDGNFLVEGAWQFTLDCP